MKNLIALMGAVATGFGLFAGDLASAFHAAAENVEVSIGPAGGKIEVELLKQTDVNAGFMKVEPNRPTVE